MGIGPNPQSPLIIKLDFLKIFKFIIKNNLRNKYLYIKSYFYLFGPNACSKLTTLARNSFKTSVNCSLFSFKKFI